MNVLPTEARRVGHLHQEIGAAEPGTVEQHPLVNHVRTVLHGALGRARGPLALVDGGGRTLRDHDHRAPRRAIVLEHARFVRPAAKLQHAPFDLVFSRPRVAAERHPQVEQGSVRAFGERPEIGRRQNEAGG